ncbi:HigA family addiction module antitoxin [Thiorhodovibrio frisius]|uniref:Addiction module antidote protein, HigA family n=1 Tax=Thiorhodovibrio frisius TaxID=631362 RepID=H8Z0H1_9GAMM|nr:HigA family addiction module antitoxin [Thiorhodovibrio frisius]EIC21272.1 addiction module antidote protein, HigA family [Thiorhodovibrio frisius]WPL23849.1 putative HTH-type transcriptional regulator YbaQ [Thiorhodovibrio frisius]
MSREVALVHPGEILLKDWLEPLGISQYALANAIGVPRRRINEIVRGQRAISADTATRLGVFFDVDAQGWLALQAHCDAEQARERLREELPRIPRYDRETTARPKNDHFSL